MTEMNESAQEQEYECLATLRDMAIVIRNLYVKSHGHSPALDDTVNVLSSHTETELTRMFSEDE